MIPENDPNRISWAIQAAPWLSAILLSMMGGAVHYLDKINRRSLPFRLANFIVEIFISAFTGIVAFELCDSAGLGWENTAAICAISGHMGARAWFLAEKAVVEPLLERYGYDRDGERKVKAEEKTD